jgi:hypothetical protein
VFEFEISLHHQRFDISGGFAKKLLFGVGLHGGIVVLFVFAAFVVVLVILHLRQ